MTRIVEHPNCVNSSANITKFAQISALLRQDPNLNNHIVAGKFGCRADYVRSVRSKLGIPSPGRAKKHQPLQTRDELRVLAHKLYDMRQEGLL